MWERMPARRRVADVGAELVTLAEPSVGATASAGADASTGVESGAVAGHGMGADAGLGADVDEEARAWVTET
jgi:hypothetical protein